MSQKELLSAFQSGLSQSFSLVDQMSEDQRQAAAVALQGLLQKTPIASVINRDTKVGDATSPNTSPVTLKVDKNSVTVVDGKVYKLPKRGRPPSAEFIHLKNNSEPCLDMNKSEKVVKLSKVKDYDKASVVEGKPKQHIKGAACDVCGRYFSQRGNMLRHRMRHTGERPWQCETCGEGFIEKKSLMIHSKNKHNPQNDDIMFCGVCGLKFRSKLHAAKHSCLKNKALLTAKDKSTNSKKGLFTVSIKRKVSEGQEKKIKHERTDSKLDMDVETPSGEHEIAAHDLEEMGKQICQYEDEEGVLDESFDIRNSDRDHPDYMPNVTMEEQTNSMDGSGKEDNPTEFNKDIARKIMSAIAKEHLTSQNANPLDTCAVSPSKETVDTSNLAGQRTTSSEIQLLERANRETDSMLNSVIKDEKTKEAEQNIFVLTGKKTLKAFSLPKQTCSNWECPQCPQTAKEFRSLWVHLKSHYEGGSLQCRYCDLNLASLSSLQRHYLSTHGTPLFKCCHCAKSFRTYISYEQHMKFCMDGIFDASDPQQCPVCEKQYSSAVTLRAHIAGKHSEKRFKCSFCSRSFNFASNLIRHTKLHTGERRHQCELCGEGFIERKCLVTHMMRKHPDTPLDLKSEGGVNCNVCGKGFGSQSLLNVHMLVHTKQNNFSCSTCGKTFSLKANLKRHELTHTGAKPFLCSVCGKAFTEKRSVTVHMRQHTGERPFKCPHCPKAFTQSGNLEAHLPVHTKLRKFLCTLCGASFLRRTHYAQHMKKHNGPPDTPCPHCPALFYRTTDLRRHLLTHNTQNKCYECSVCGAKFSEPSHLYKHHKVHEHTSHYQEQDLDANIMDDQQESEEEEEEQMDESPQHEEEEEMKQQQEDIQQIIDVASHLDPSQLDPAENEVIYVQEAEPLVLFAGTDPILEAKPGAESDTAPNAEPAIEANLSVEVSTKPNMELSEGLNIVEQSNSGMDSETAIAFQEVSEIEAGDEVIEIDGLDGVDPSQLALQQFPDHSGYYVIIHGTQLATEAEQTVITD